jgi:hypothetical protein
MGAIQWTRIDASLPPGAVLRHVQQRLTERLD